MDCTQTGTNMHCKPGTANPLVTKQSQPLQTLLLSCCEPPPKAVQLTHHPKQFIFKNYGLRFPASSTLSGEHPSPLTQHTRSATVGSIPEPQQQPCPLKPNRWGHIHGITTIPASARKLFRLPYTLKVVGSCTPLLRAAVNTIGTISGNSSGSVTPCRPARRP